MLNATSHTAIIKCTLAMSKPHKRIIQDSNNSSGSVLTSFCGPLSLHPLSLGFWGAAAKYNLHVSGCFEEGVVIVT